MLHPAPPQQAAPSVFGVRQPLSRRGSTVSVASTSSDHYQPQYAADSNNNAAIAHQIQRCEDAGDYPTALRLRYGMLESVAVQKQEAVSRLNLLGGTGSAVSAQLAAIPQLEEVLLDSGDEYIRRVNFYALMLVNQRNFKEAGRLLQHAASFVDADPRKRPVNIFNDAALSSNSMNKNSNGLTSSTAATSRGGDNASAATAVVHRRVLHRAAATIENNKGLCAYKAGKLHDAEIHFFASASMEEQLGDDADNPAATLFNLAQVQSALGKSKACVDCTTAAAEHLRERLADPRLLLVQQDEVRQLLLHVLFLKGAAEKDLRRFESALATFREAVDAAMTDHSPTDGPVMVKYAESLLHNCVAAAKRDRLAPQHPKSATAAGRARSATSARRPLSAVSAASSSAGGRNSNKDLVGAGLLGTVIRPYSAARSASSSASNLPTQGASAGRKKSTPNINANDEGTNEKLAPFYRREKIVTSLSNGVNPSTLAANRARVNNSVSAGSFSSAAAAAAIDDEYAAILGGAYLGTTMPSSFSTAAPLPPLATKKPVVQPPVAAAAPTTSLPFAGDRGESVHWGEGSTSAAVVHHDQGLESISSMARNSISGPHPPRSSSVTFVAEDGRPRHNPNPTASSPSPTSGILASSSGTNTVPSSIVMSPSPIVMNTPSSATATSNTNRAPTNDNNSFKIPSRPTTAPRGRPSAGQGSANPSARQLQSGTDGQNSDAMANVSVLRDDSPDDFEAKGELKLPSSTNTRRPSMASDYGSQQQQQQHLHCGGRGTSAAEGVVKAPPASLGGGHDGPFGGSTAAMGDIADGNNNGAVPTTTEDLLLAAAAKLGGQSYGNGNTSGASHRFASPYYPNSTAAVLSSSPGLQSVYEALTPKHRRAFEVLTSQQLGTAAQQRLVQPPTMTMEEVAARTPLSARGTTISGSGGATNNSAQHPSSASGGGRRHLSPNRQFPYVAPNVSQSVGVEMGTGRSTVGANERLPSPPTSTRTSPPTTSRTSPPTTTRKISPTTQRFALRSSAGGQQQHAATTKRTSPSSSAAGNAAGRRGSVSPFGASITGANGRRKSSLFRSDSAASGDSTILYGGQSNEDLMMRATEHTAREMAAEIFQRFGRGFATRKDVGMKKALSDEIRLRLREEVRFEEQRVAELRAAEIIREHDRQLEAKRHALGTEVSAAVDVLRNKQRASIAGGSSVLPGGADGSGMMSDDIITLFKASVVNIPTGPAVPRDVGDEDDYDEDDYEEVSMMAEVEEDEVDHTTGAKTGLKVKVMRRQVVRQRKPQASLDAQTMVTSDAVGDLIVRQRQHALKLQQYQEEQHRAIEAEKARRREGIKTLVTIQAHLRAMRGVKAAVAKHAAIRSRLLEAYAEQKQREHAVAALRRHEPLMAERRRARQQRREEEEVALEEKTRRVDVIVAFAQGLAATRALEDLSKQCALSHVHTIQAVAKAKVAAMLTQAYCCEDIELAHRQQTAAAVVIQAIYRGYAARMLKQRLMREFVAEVYQNRSHFAASKIQATWRMHRYGKPIKPLIAAHGAKMYALAEAEGRRLRLRAVAPVIQRAYRCHLARRAANFLRNAMLNRRRDYLSLAMKDYAARAIQSFARIVAAKKLVRHQKAVMADILKFREQQRNRMIADHKTNTLHRIAVCLVQRVIRGYGERRTLRFARIQRVAEWDAMQQQGQQQ